MNPSPDLCNKAGPVPKCDMQEDNNMPKDIVKTAEARDALSDEVSADLRELRSAVQDLGKLLGVVAQLMPEA